MPGKAPKESYDKSMKYKKAKKKSTVSPVVAVLFLIALWYAVIGRSILPQALARLQLGSNQAVSKKVYYDFACSEANLARVLALTLDEGNKSNEQNDSQQLWYEKYYEELEGLQITSLKQEDAFASLSAGKFKQVLQEVFGEVKVGNELQDDKEQLNLGKVLEIYDTLLQSQSSKLSIQSLAVLATPSDDVELEPWQLVSDKGKFYFEGLVVDPVKNETLKVASWEDQLLGIIEIEDKSCCLKECKITGVEDNKATFEINDIELSYKQKDSVSKEDIGKVGTITITESQITAFSIEAIEKVDTLVSITKDKITLDKAGTFTYANISLYDEIGKNDINLAELPYGTRISYAAEGNQLISMKVLGESTETDIRVVLTNKGSYEQAEVKLTGNADYDLVYGGKASTLTAGDSWQSEKFAWDGENTTVRLVPRTDSMLTITSMEKSEGAPSYKGIIEVKKTDSGYVLINEVDMESYVAGVISSEMPTSYGAEALKAQAVAARTYGAACLQQSRFMAYSANVDDTTASQVYNQIPADEAACKAAEETAGMVLKSEGQLISNKFFGTSCGYTANFGEVWAGSSFPSDSPSYLVSRQQYLGERMGGNLQDEESFKQFIELNADDMDAFDEDSPWFRWKVSLTKEELENLMLPNLKRIGEAYPNLVTYESKAGVKQEQPVSQMGGILDIKAGERGEGGNLMVLEVEAEKANVKVSTEYLIRSLFASGNTQGLTVIRSDNSKVNNMSLLPSAFFTIETKMDSEGNLQMLILEGGGNGHGVGLSQDGAKGMAERGYTAQEILAHYYPNSELVQLAAEG